MNSESGWKVACGYKLHRHRWADETLLFHEGSGDTHLFGHFEVQVLDYLQDHTATLPEIMSFITTGSGEEADDEFFFYIERVVTQLERLGVIERVRA